MDGKCAIIITRGKNKGKICGDINTKCKHTSKPMLCHTCGAEFIRSTSYYRHIKLHSNESQCSHSSSPSEKIKLDIKPKIKVNRKPDNTQVILDKLQAIERQNNDLKSEVKALKERRPVTNYNISVIGNSEDLYTELLSLMGGNHQHTMQFLTESCTNENAISVFQRLYLDGKSPDDYPVAFRDPMHFRYLDPKRQIVDDRDGKIGKLVGNQLINTYLLAANDTMARDILSAGDLRLLQEKAALINASTDLTEQLAHLTKNPDHPFFK